MKDLYQITCIRRDQVALHLGELCESLNSMLLDANAEIFDNGKDMMQIVIKTRHGIEIDCTPHPYKILPERGF